MKWDPIYPEPLDIPKYLGILVSQGKVAGLDKPDTAIPS